MLAGPLPRSVGPLIKGARTRRGSRRRRHSPVRLPRADPIHRRRDESRIAPRHRESRSPNARAPRPRRPTVESIGLSPDLRLSNSPCGAHQMQIAPPGGRRRWGDRVAPRSGQACTLRRTPSIRATCTTGTTGLRIGEPDRSDDRPPGILPARPEMDRAPAHVTVRGQAPASLALAGESVRLGL